MIARGLAYCPWTHAEALGVRVVERRLRGSRWGEYDDPSRTVILDPRLNWVESRCVLAHEVQHAIARDVPTRYGPVNQRQERRARLQSALLLVDVGEYAQAEETHGGASCGIAADLDVIPEVLDDWRLAMRCAGVLA